MSMSDPISDLLTRIRNAHIAKHRVLDVPASKMKLEIVKIMKDEGFIEDFETEEGVQGVIKIRLKYVGADQAAISGMQRISKPGRRVYRGKDDIPKVLNGLGITIVSTAQGVMTGAACRKSGVGGEILCNVW